MCLYVLQSKATLLLLLLLLSRYLFTSPSLYHAITKLLCCFVSMCLDGEFAVFSLFYIALLCFEQSKAMQGKTKQSSSRRQSQQISVTPIVIWFDTYCPPVISHSELLKAKQSNVRQRRKLLCLASHCFAQSKAKQCNLLKFSSLPYIALLCCD